MAWRVAGSLIRLRDQINAFAPSRSKVSDGTIGDTAHTGSASDHNPNASGVVCALDITHDPSGGLDAHALADHLIANRNSQLKYVVSNNRIAGSWTGWRWQAYNGSNPHTKHIHISVGVGGDGQSKPPYDDTQDWNVNYKQGDSEVITKDDVGFVRIGHSEIGGWDLNRTHAGEFDKLFMDAWVGKSAKEFVWAQWTAGASYRSAKEALKLRVAELEAALTGTKSEILAAQNAVAQANIKVEQESAKATEAGKKVLELEAQRLADEEAGKSFLRRLGQFLSNLISK